MTTERKPIFEMTARLITRGLLTALGCCALAAAQTNQGCQTGNPEYVTAWLSNMAAELREVHLEALQERRDILQARISELGQEIETVQNRQLHEQRTRDQELSEVEAQLSQPNLAKAERGTL